MTNGIRIRPVGTKLTLIVVAALATLVSGVASAEAKTVDAYVGAGGDKRMQAPSGVVQGDTVRFVFQDNGHDMGLGGPETTNVAQQRKGFVISRTLDRPGTYSFACSLHDNMSASFDVAPDPNAGDRSGKEYDEVDIVVDGDGRGNTAPKDVTIEEGQTVQWAWGKDSYTVDVDGTRGSGSIGNAPFAHTFTKAGTYPYSTSAGSGTVTVAAKGSLNDGVRTAPAGATPAATVTVGGGGNSFSPNAVTIDEGQVVQWNWASGPHNVRFSDGTSLPIKTSGSGALKFYNPRATAYSYVCSLHAGMSGTVLVRDTGAAGPNEQAPAPDPSTGSEDSASGGDPGSGSTAGGTKTSGASSEGGVAGFAAAAATVAGSASSSSSARAAGTARPVLKGLRGSFRSGRRSNRLSVDASEDVRLDVTLRRLGRSKDLITRRAIKLFVRKGQRSVKLPVLNLTPGTYRLRVLAVDQAGNRSAPATVRLTVRR